MDSRPVTIPPAGPIIYLLDGDPAFLAGMSRFLRTSGYAVEAFSSPDKFLEKMPSAGNGCLILDLQMPGLTGFEIQAAVAKQESPLRIIFLTGEGDVHDAVRAMRQGAEDFLAKDGPKAELLRAIKRALARNAREQAERQGQI
jgi:FixJ family two-component response regulator